VGFIVIMWQNFLNPELDKVPEASIVIFVDHHIIAINAGTITLCVQYCTYRSRPTVGYHNYFLPDLQ